MTPTLHLDLFGGLLIHFGDRQPIKFVSRRAELFVAWILLNPGHHGRERISELLWNDKEPGRSASNLRSLLSRLPKEAKAVLDINRQTIGVQPNAAIAIDLNRFDELATADPKNAVPLARGPVLDGVFVDDSLELEEWMALLREGYRQKQIDLLSELATQAYYKREHAKGVELAQKLVQLDPFREASQRQLIRLLAKSGRRADAIQQFEMFEALLVDEFGVEPEEESLLLAQQIRQPAITINQTLPQSPTPFFGRADDVARIGRQFDQPDCRLLTILGMGGMGKTRLALELARERQNDFINGLVFANLTDVVSTDGILQRLVFVLNLTTSGGSSEQLVLQHLSGRETCLVLDNFEQLVDEGGPELLDKLLREAPSLKLMVTSRARLNLRSEWVAQVDGMAVDEAYAFFLQSLVRQGVTLPIDQKVAQLCTQLQGHPLALELAASLLPLQSIDALLAGLEADMTDLTGRYRDLPSRQQSLDATMNYSWRLLSSEQQVLLAQLSIFRGGFDHQAVQAITQQGRLLSRLVDRSLVSLTDLDRYDLHEVVRQFAAEKLREMGKIIESEATFVTYFSSLACELHTHLRISQSPAEMQSRQADDNNIIKAFQLSKVHQEWGLFGDMIEPISEFYQVKSQFFATLQLLQTARANLPKNQTSPEFMAAKARLLLFIGSNLERSENYPDTIKTFGIAAPLIEQFGTERDKFWLKTRLGLIEYNQGAFQHAQTHFESALDLSKIAGDETDSALCHNHLGYIALAKGELNIALPYFEQAVTIYEKQNNLQNIAISLNGIGDVYLSQDKLDEAAEQLKKAWGISEQLDDKYGIAMTRNNLGDIALKQKNFTEAKHHYSEVIELNGKTIQDSWLMMVGHSKLGNVALIEKDSTSGKVHFEQLMKLSKDNPIGRHKALVGLGTVSLLENDAAQALVYLTEGFEIAYAAGAIPFACDALPDLGQALLKLSQQELGIDCLAVAHSHPAATDNVRRKAEALLKEVSILTPKSSPTFDKLAGQIISLK